MLQSRLGGFCKIYPMNSNLKRLFSIKKGEIPPLMGLTLSTILFFLSFSPVLAPSYLSEAEAGFRVPLPQTTIVETPIIQENSLLTSANNYLLENTGIAVLEIIPMTITAYSSSVWETDDTPFITASGTQTRDGVIASNLLPFGTKVRIPKLFGEKIFVVEDRMNKRMGDFQIDIWFPSSQLAKNFGIKNAYVETIK